MSVPHIRLATDADAAAIADIYNHYIRASTSTFDTEEKPVADRIAWLAEHTAAYPVLVAELDGDVVAWGSLSRWGTRCAYQHTVEISVYVREDSTGSGVGPQMTGALIAEARRIGHHSIVSQITAENRPSLKMAERLGFRYVGTLHEVGRKFGRWLDVVLMEFVIDAETPGEDR